MSRPLRTGLAIGTAALFCVSLAACAPDYSPNTYSSAAAQQANKVDQGVIVGVRAIRISTDTTLATASGGAAGGVVGATVGGGSAGALGAVGGTLAGGVVGNIAGHAAGDTDGFEYIVKKGNGDLLSVTQKDPQPLVIGAHVLIIEGPQARVVPDYTVPVVAEALHPEEAKQTAKAEPVATPLGSMPPGTAPAAQAGPAASPSTPAVTAVVATPLPPPSSQQPAPIATEIVAQPPAAATPPVGEQKPATPPAETPPAPKPEETPAPKPASGS